MAATAKHCSCGEREDKKLQMTRDQVLDWIRRYAAAIAEHEQQLTELDTALGDGDHGINMAHGMSEVAAKLPGLAERDIGAIFNSVGMTLLSKVGTRRPVVRHVFYALQQGERRQAATDRGGVSGRAGGRRAGHPASAGAHSRAEKTMVDALAPAARCAGRWRTAADCRRLWRRRQRRRRPALRRRFRCRRAKATPAIWGHAASAIKTLALRPPTCW